MRQTQAFFAFFGSLWYNLDAKRFKADDIARMHRWSRPIKPPSTPPRRDPNEPPFDPSEFMGEIDTSEMSDGLSEFWDEDEEE